MILIEPDVSVPRSALPKRELSRFLSLICERVGLKGSVTVLLANDLRLRELNRAYRRKDQATDVLSFPAAPAAFAGARASGGDLAISVDTALRQADALGHSLLVEVEILLLHGVLHLAGFDHEQDQGEMARRERRLRRDLELPAGLIQRVTTSPAGAKKAPSKARRVATLDCSSSPTVEPSLSEIETRAQPARGQAAASSGSKGLGRVAAKARRV